MTAERPPPRASPVLIAAVALSLAVGAAASLIAGAARAGAFQPTPSADFFLTTGQLTLVAIVVLILLVGFVLWRLAVSRRAAVPGHLAVTALAFILITVLFVELVRLFVPGGLGSGTVSPSNNSTGNGTGPGTNGTSPGGGASSPGGPLGFFTIHLPPWFLFVAVALGAIVVTAVAVPYLWRRAAEAGTPRRAGPADLAAVEVAFASAARELNEGDEPRQVVIRLYSKLLARIGPLVDGMDQQTPEEIRSLHLTQLGIREEAATTLTRLFEEARYSSHPLGPDEAGRARWAIARAREDLDRPRAEP
jgi:hypothetical protein